MATTTNPTAKPKTKTKILPNRLAELRKKARLDQAEVAKILDLTEAAVSRHEGASRSLSDDVIEKYAKLYKVPSHKLFAK